MSTQCGILVERFRTKSREWQNANEQQTSGVFQFTLMLCSSHVCKSNMCSSIEIERLHILVVSRNLPKVPLKRKQAIYLMPNHLFFKKLSLHALVWLLLLQFVVWYGNLLTGGHANLKKLKQVCHANAIFFYSFIWTQWRITIVNFLHISSPFRTGFVNIPMQNNHHLFDGCVFTRSFKASFAVKFQKTANHSTLLDMFVCKQTPKGVLSE